MGKRKPRSSLSTQLRDHVNKSELSRYEICKRAGISQTTLSFFMRRKRSITLDTAGSIAKVLGLSLTKDSD